MWANVVDQVCTFIELNGLRVRETVVLLPFAQHLPLIRQAWLKVRPVGWMPRFETTQTLAKSFPAPAAPELGPSGDIVADRLAAAQLLGAQAWADAARKRDPSVFQHWVEELVNTSGQLLKAADAIAPEARDEFWDKARARVEESAGPGALESALSRIAIEWAALRDTGPLDALFDFEPAGWVIIHAGGRDAVGEALVQRSFAPVLRLETDPEPESWFDETACGAKVVACADFEAEAQTAAGQVMRHIEAGQLPVALIAQDRIMVRRVRALLERQQVRLRDETGWKLSTTRAAACIAGLLGLARYRASTDDLLDWLKSSFVLVGEQNTPEARQLLEQGLRKQRAAVITEVKSSFLEPSARELFHAVVALTQKLSKASRGSLAQWQQRLRAVLEASGIWAIMEADVAGIQALQTLRLTDGAAQGAFAAQAESAQMELSEYTNWVDSMLEAGAFNPPSLTEPEVVITPMVRAMLRPFGAAVMPGCDDQLLGAAARIPGWLSEAERADLGLPTREKLRTEETIAFAHLLRRPVTLLWRRSEEGSPRNPSVLLERLRLARQRFGTEPPAWQDPLVERACDLVPVQPAAPSGPHLLPGQMSATSYEALRSCPYSFFAKHMLSLREQRELDEEVEHRDYGTWMHAVLRAFHERRASEPLPYDQEVPRMLAIGQEKLAALGLSRAAFLPYSVRFEQVAHSYISWLADHESKGGAFRQAEVELTVPGPGVDLHGQLDRVDDVSGEQAETLLVDYKTGSQNGLREKLRVPLEDTQLPFYAAVWRKSPNAQSNPKPVRAIYLALEGDIKSFEHEEVEASADKLLSGLDRDLQRIRSGASLPPMGEGAVCDYCEVRGLCRKNHWSATASSSFK